MIIAQNHPYYQWYNTYMKQPPYDAPDFTLQDTDGNSVSLTDFAGKWLVLYFYPKDDTPGCTVEACSLRDAHADITALGAHVVGVSKDDAPSHAAFRAKHSLNFTLLSDHEGSVIEAYEAWGKKMFGKEGILRRTFIINPAGTVVKVFGRVTPVGHGDQVVAELKKLQS
jgi:peroxiredoxin Q/BCP